MTDHDDRRAPQSMAKVIFQHKRSIRLAFDIQEVRKKP